MRLRLEFLDDEGQLIDEINSLNMGVPVPVVGERVAVTDKGEWEVEDRLFIYGEMIGEDTTKITFYCKRPG